MMDGLSTEYLFGPLQLARPRADAQALEKGYVELGVDTAVEVAAGRRDTALPLQHTEMVRAHAEAFSYPPYLDVSCRVISVHACMKTGAISSEKAVNVARIELAHCCETIPGYSGDDSERGPRFLPLTIRAELNTVPRPKV